MNNIKVSPISKCNKVSLRLKPTNAYIRPSIDFETKKKIFLKRECQQTFYCKQTSPVISKSPVLHQKSIVCNTCVTLGSFLTWIMLKMLQQNHFFFTNYNQIFFLLFTNLLTLSKLQQKLCLKKSASLCVQKVLLLSNINS